jgi:hypothetical protein
VFAAHELFHFFVIAGSACHVFFMHEVVVPVSEPAPLPSPSPTTNRPHHTTGLIPAMASRRGRSWQPHFPPALIWAEPSASPALTTKMNDLPLGPPPARQTPELLERKSI